MGIQTSSSNGSYLTLGTEAVVQRCSVKKVVLKISQISQENMCRNLFFNKVVGLRPATLLKRDSGTGVFL